MSTRPFQTWDIFCRVIDNYGDIGVCWRLARQLASEYPFQIRLWVDDLSALSKIWPSVSNKQNQHVEGVDIRIWREDFVETEVADVVVEAFACELPQAYLAAMKTRSITSHWFNLEYLSAEDWVEGCHGLLSLHPSLGLKKAFFFPGFTDKTGGLIKEANLLENRDDFLSNTQSRLELFKSLGVEKHDSDLVISLFGYENNAVALLLETWIGSPKPVLCLIPESKILSSVSHHLGKDLTLGDELAKGSLRIKIIPFLNQSGYDELLWACDMNFVRGEDSFLRAQWAQKPFIWHIYPQDDDIHLAKLDAFLKLYLSEASPELAAAITDLWHHWNRGEDASESWKACITSLENWQKHGRDWCQQLNSLEDLASNMVQFCQKTL